MTHEQHLADVSALVEDLVINGLLTFHHAGQVDYLTLKGISG